MIQGPVPRHAPPTVEETRRALADVLADPGLQRGLQPRSDVQRALEDLWRRIRGWFSDLTDGLLDLRFESPVLFWLVFGALVLVALLLLAHIGWTVAQAMRTPRRESGPERPDQTDEQGRRARSRALRSRAHELAHGGDRRAGVRHLLLAMLALLEERRLLTVARSWTVREVLERLARRVPELFALAGGPAPPARPGRTDLVARIEHACYGASEVSQGDFLAVDGWLDDLLGASPEAGQS